MKRPGAETLRVNIYPDSGTIALDFKLAIKGLGLDEEGARHLAQLLIEAAEELKRRKN